MKILITRPLDESMNLAKKIVKLGHQPIISPLLEIELFQNIDFESFNKYDGIIISSKNALKAIDQADKNLKLFIVGERTTQFAKTLGFLNSICAGANIIELKETMQQYNNLLYLSGVDISDSLNSLEKKIDRLEVYQAQRIESASNNFLDFIKLDGLRLCLLFSKRTAQIFIDFIKEYKLESYCKNIMTLSLSERIDDELKTIKLGSYYVSEEPTLKSMISSISRICR